jgi:toxin YoeB
MSNLSKKIDLFFTDTFNDDLKIWEKDGQREKAKKKIKALLVDIVAHPFSGIGKPEHLLKFANCWSRRIIGKHRLVYMVDNGLIKLLRCRDHYDD